MKPLLPVLSIMLATMQAAELPVREVILYKSGVAYFERRGHLEGGEAAHLDFKAGEMNDVLKSLAVQDLSGGKITGLRYDSSEPVDRKLGDFPFKLGSSQSLSGFLDQVKGAAIELKSGAESAAGAVVGARSIDASEKEPGREQVVLLLNTGELRTFDLSGVSLLRFADGRLQLQLKDYLAALDQARTRDKRSVYIDSADGKARDLRASYMIPMPVWKSSYRLIFGEKSEPALEGWAIVDNTTGDDWTNVRLAVVSGRPVSFISRLYEPRYLDRPAVDLPDEGPVQPSVYEAAMSTNVALAPGVAGDARTEQFAKPQSPPPPTFKQEARTGRVSSIGMGTETRDLGDLFEYRFTTPVTVKKNESAMLPFLQQSIGARKLLIYRDGSGQNPMSAAEIANSTGKTLDGGPITVFDANGYSGEALMETLKAGDKRLISYAVDLGTRVTTKFDSTAEVVRELHLRRGILTTRLASEETLVYTIRNVDPKTKTLVIEHPQRPEYKLLSQKAAETTANAYRFEVNLPADSSQKFTVREERVFSSELLVSTLGPDVLVEYARNRTLPEATRRDLERIGNQKQKIAATTSGIQQAEAAMNDFSADEQRIRQNIDSLRMVQSQIDQVNKYASQLAARETEIAVLRDRLSQMKKDLAEQQAELEAMVAKLEF